MTGSAVAGLILLNSPGLQGQPCTETSGQSLLKALGPHFLKLALLVSAGTGLFNVPMFVAIAKQCCTELRPFHFLIEDWEGTEVGQLP